MKRNISVFLLIFCVLFPPSGIMAADLEITADGEYVMGEGETLENAGEKARRNAIRSAAEQAGTFVRSYSKVRNLTLEEDIIEVVANHAMKVTVLDEQTELIGKKTLRFRTRIRAVLSEAEVEANIRKAQADRTIAEAHRKLQEDYA
ncbi:MAG: hypothetical protein U1C55_02380, partial [Smithellaceae bacterium]|nr:hypothetical protein [Smithellaceae bacterium]